MSNFQFKEFSIKQDNSVMKVGTDGVLLGSWACCKKTDRILDVGSGTGLISLMLAQRYCKSRVVGIEIDQISAKESELNVYNSKWSQRIEIINVSLQKFVSKNKFDLIVSNPPFFVSYQLKKRKSIAKHMNKLSFSELIENCSKLLLKDGIFAVIIPVETELQFYSIAKKYNLYCNRACYVKGHSKSKVKRVMMEFSFHDIRSKIENLTIEYSRHEYTEEYIKLTQDFYLDM